MNTNKTISEIELIEEILDKLKTKLQTEITASSISNKAKIPFKAKILKESLLYRILDLSECGILLYNSQKIIPSLIIIRATFETLALLYNLNIKIKDSIDKSNLEEIDNFLMKSISGSRLKDVNNITQYESINVLTLINRFSKDIPAFRENYDILSEFAHPNAFGTTSTYSKLNKGERKAQLGFKQYKFPNNVGIISLKANLLVFEMLIDEFDNLFSTFIKLCEDIINSNT